MTQHVRKKQMNTVLTDQELDYLPDKQGCLRRGGSTLAEFEASSKSSSVTSSVQCEPWPLVHNAEAYEQRPNSEKLDNIVV